MPKEMKYIAIKVKGFDHWLWFEMDKISEGAGNFQGKCGWGEDGAFTEIDIPSNEIIGRMWSNTPQY